MATPVTGYLSRVSGPRRSPRYDLHLACLLILVAGMLNSAGFVAVALYTSHMTGLTATMADHRNPRNTGGGNTNPRNSGRPSTGKPTGGSRGGKPTTGGGSRLGSGGGSRPGSGR